jgi:hypothetical protein
MTTLFLLPVESNDEPNRAARNPLKPLSSRLSSTFWQTGDLCHVEYLTWPKTGRAAVSGKVSNTTLFGLGGIKTGQP